MEFVWFLIIGGIAGYIGSLLFKGSGSGIIKNVILGVIGAIVGGWVFGVLGISVGNGLIGSLITAAVGAFLLMWVASLISK